MTARWRPSATATPWLLASALNPHPNPNTNRNPIPNPNPNPNPNPDPNPNPNPNPNQAEGGGQPPEGWPQDRWPQEGAMQGTPHAEARHPARVVDMALATVLNACNMANQPQRARAASSGAQLADM